MTKQKRIVAPPRRGVRARRARPSTVDEYRRELEQRNAELAIINSVQQALASKLDMQAIYDLVGDKIREIFDAQVVVITTCDLSASLIHTNYLFEDGRRFFPEPYQPSPFAARLIASRQSTLVRTRKEFEELGSRTTPGTAKTHSGIFVPLLVGEELRGGISLQNIDRENAFDESDVRLLETFASSMSVALENARLFNETKRLLNETQQRAAELAIINSVQQGLASQLEMQAIYDLVGDKIREIFDAQAVSISTFDLEKETLAVQYSIEKGRRFYPEPHPYRTIARQLIRTRRPLLFQTQAQLAATGVPVIPGTEDAKSALYVPLVVGDTVQGSISLQNVDRENAFSESDVRLLETLASSMSIALENARLFDETQRLLKETEHRAAELRIINSVQQALASKLDMQAIYELIGDKIHEIFFDAQVVDILTYDRTTDLLYPRYVIERGKRFEVKPWSLVGFRKYVVATRKPLVINRDLDRRAAEFGNPRIIVGEMSQSAVYVPMIVGDKVTAIISLQHLDRENAFSESDVRLLETLANAMSVALENVQLRDKERVYLKGLERELEIGRQIQFSFLPDELPQPPGWEIAARFLPAGQVSGDLYDVFALQGDGTIGLVIADVCDKGVGAALYMALFRSLIRATSNLDYFAGQTSPASGQPAPFSHTANLKNAVVLTNNYIARTHEQANMFATVFFGVLDPATGVLSYINGGHEPPIIFGAGGVKTTLVRTGMAVGLMPDIPFGIAEARLEPGDTLLAFTDGVVDAQNSANESFSREKLLSLLTPAASSTAALIDRIEASVREHIADASQFDDITMLAVHRLSA